MELNEFQRSRLRDGREYRYLTLEVRAQEGEDGAWIVEGYATTFGQPYTLYSSENRTVQEQFDPHAFDECDMTDVIMQLNHEGRVYARTRNSTLVLRIDAKGLHITADLGGTEEGRKLYQEIKGGYIDRMSIGFIVGVDEIAVTEDQITGAVTVLRTILKVKKLFDVSAVSIPANDMTSISARSASAGIEERLREMETRRKAKELKLRLLLEGI